MVLEPAGLSPAHHLFASTPDMGILPSDNDQPLVSQSPIPRTLGGGV